MIRLVHEFDPKFRLLYVVNAWKTPNDGVVKTQNYMLARQVVNPITSNDWIKNPMMPNGPVGGVYYRAPFLSAQILDARTNSEIQRGKLPKFEPFTRKHVESMRAALWLRENRTTDEVEREIQETAAADERAVDRKLHADAIYRRQNDWLQNRHVHGKADRVYVSSTLERLRAAAGAAA